MSNGGYKGASPARETSPEQYPGVWELTEQFQAQADGNWPFQADDCAPKSLKFNASGSTYLSKTPAAAGNRKTWTWSGWVKKNASGVRQMIFGNLDSGAVTGFDCEFQSDDTLDIYDYNGGYETRRKTTQVFRDPSAWYHIVVTYDSTNATAADRLRLYVNGDRVTTFSQSTDPTFGADGRFNTAAETSIGRSGAYGLLYLDSCVADVHFIDGQALSCEEFGFFDGQGIWQPKRFTGDYSSGPVYSNSSDENGLVSSGTLALLFDGNTTTNVNIDNSNDYAIATQNQSIPVTSTIGMWTITGASYPTMRVTDTNGTVTVLDHNDTTIVNGGWTDFSYSGTVAKIELAYIPGSGSSNAFYALRVDGVILTDASVGRNSFHLDFSDGVKDQSGLDNDWTGNNVSASPGYTGTVQFGSDSNDNSFDSSATSLTLDTTGYTYSTVTDPKTDTGNANIATVLKTADGTAIDWSFSTDTTDRYIWTSSNGINWTSTGTLYDTDGSTQTVNAAYVAWAGGSNASILTVSWGQGADIFVDSPVNGNEASTGAGGERRGNYATLNPLAVMGSGGLPTLSNGNLQVNFTGSSNRGCSATFGMSSGKWYWEITYDSGTVQNPGQIYMGISRKTSSTNRVDESLAVRDYGVLYNSISATVNGTNMSTSSAGVVWQFAYDADNKKLWIGRNNSWSNSGDPASGTTPTFSAFTGDTFYPFISDNVSTAQLTFNFGQRSFSYAPPSGFSPLATSFLPEPTVKRGDEAMDVSLWTGNNTEDRLIPTSNSPGLIWIKQRNDIRVHILQDVVRGFTKGLYSNDASTESTRNPPYGETVSGGFEVSSTAGSNVSGRNYVAWAWDAGDTTTTIAAGSLNSSAYNTSDRWRDDVAGQTYGSQSKTRLFDGNIAQNLIAESGYSLTFSPAGFSSITSLRIYGASYTGNANGIVINGTDYTSLFPSGSTTPAWVTIPETSLTSIVWSTQSNGLENGSLNAIEVNGQILIDDDATPPNVPLVATDVRARTDAGFSIAKWSKSANNQSYAHGLSQAPEFIIAKSLDGGHSWRVWHKDLDNNKNLLLDGSGQQDTYTAMLGIPDAYKVPLIAGGPGGTNGGMIAYNFHSVEGYCHVGSYEGGSAPFVFCGFRPRFIYIKNADTNGEEHVLYDAARDVDNPAGATLYANTTGAEFDGNGSSNQRNIDILSNGFKINTGNPINSSGTHVFVAWAEHPFASNARAR